jgi:hypothetical protein
MGFSPGLIRAEDPRLKPRLKHEAFFRSAEPLLPRINAGAPT